MGDELVSIASYWTLWEAELALARLEAESIPARLGNAALVYWVWHYSNAVGGVRVDVAARDAEAARAVVNPAHDEPAEGSPPWTCSRCGTRGFASWDVCWNCGDSKDGISEPASCGDEAVRPETPDDIREKTGSAFLVFLAAMVLVAIFSIGGFVSFLAAAALVVFVLLLFRQQDSGEGETGAVEEEDSRVAPVARNSIVERAWRAAVFGCFAFPPLGLYSLWLLWRVFFRRRRLGGIDRLRFVVALILDILAIPLTLMILVAPSVIAYAAVGPFLAEFFRLARAVLSK